MSGSRWQGSDSGDPLNVHRARNGADTDQVSTVQYSTAQYSKSTVQQHYSIVYSAACCMQHGRSGLLLLVSSDSLFTANWRYADEEAPLLISCIQTRADCIQHGADRNQTSLSISLIRAQRPRTYVESRNDISHHSSVSTQ